MTKRVVFVGMVGLSAALGLSAGCDLLQGLKPATLVETGGGGQGGNAGAGGTSTGATGTGTTATVCEPGRSIACYTGPDGTDGVAACKGGMRACKADGSDYEETCQGEVLPQPETCSATADEDCDERDCARWAAVFGDAAVQKPLDIQTDGLGNVYVLGRFQGALDVVSPALVSAGQDDMFLVKLDTGGTVVWARQFGDAANQSFGRLSVDAAGNIAVVLRFDGLLDLGKGNLGPSGTAVAKIDTNGDTLWNVAFSPKLFAHVATHKDGNIVLWTEFSGKVDFGLGILDAGLFTDVALVQLSGADGQTVWAKRFGYSENSDIATGVAIDGGNNIVVGGSFDTKIDLGGGDIVQQNSDYAELFVGRFDKNGGFAAGASYPEMAGAARMGLDSLGSAFFSGAYEYAPSTYSSILKKVDNMVVEVWGKKFETSGMASLTTSLDDIAVAPNDDVVLAFTADGPNDLGGGDLPPIGAMDLMLARLDPDGNHLWSRRFGGAGAVQASPVLATAPNGDIVMAAQVSGTIDVGTGPLVTKGQDLLIARFAP